MVQPMGCKDAFFSFNDDDDDDGKSMFVVISLIVSPVGFAWKQTGALAWM